MLKRDYNRMLELGGNIYFTAKLGATDGHSFQHLAAVMTGNTQEDYAKMMLAGGRSVEGNRSRTGDNTPSKYLGAAAAKSLRRQIRNQGQTGQIQPGTKAKSGTASRTKSKSKSPSKSAKRK